jgi:hypothetical protein
LALSVATAIGYRDRPPAHGVQHALSRGGLLVAITSGLLSQALAKQASDADADQGIRDETAVD